MSPRHKPEMVSWIDTMLILRVSWLSGNRRARKQVLVELLNVQEHPDVVRYMEFKGIQPLTDHG
tara:strand:- start:1259 stop:1450 length:192 start_codon:yes stop_codon:yes gene_type:complete